MGACGVVDEERDGLRDLAKHVLLEPGVDLLRREPPIESPAHGIFRDPPHAGQARGFKLRDALDERGHVRLQRPGGEHGHVALRDERVHGRWHQRRCGRRDVVAFKEGTQGSGLREIRGAGERADERCFPHYRLDELLREPGRLQRGMEEQLLRPAGVAQDGQPGVAHRWRVHVCGQQLRIRVHTPRGCGPANEKDGPLVCEGGVDPGQRVARGGQHVLVVHVAAADQPRGFANGDEQARVESEPLLQVRRRAHADGAVLVQCHRGVHQRHDQLAHLAHGIEALCHRRLVHAVLIHGRHCGRVERKLPWGQAAHSVAHWPWQAHSVGIHPHEQPGSEQAWHGRRRISVRASGGRGADPAGGSQRLQHFSLARRERGECLGGPVRQCVGHAPPWGKRGQRAGRDA